MRGDALLETNIRNALLFLNNQLPRMNKYELLETLYTLNEAGHDMDYSSFLKRLSFDSLTQHQQWLMLSVLHKQKLGYENEMQKLMKQKRQPCWVVCIGAKDVTGGTGMKWQPPYWRTKRWAI